METAATPAIQDYLGAIYDLAGSDKPVIGARLARYMHLSAPSIAEVLRRMQKDGYVRVEGKKEIRLTSKGLDIAETMARRHRLLERWLTDVLGLDWAKAHDEAHRLEHALSPVVEERLAKMLGMPSTCPHGNPIPGMPVQEAHHPIPLSQAQPGQTLVVDRITEEAEADRQLLRKPCSAVGPGTRRTLAKPAPIAASTLAFSSCHHAVACSSTRYAVPRSLSITLRSCHRRAAHPSRARPATTKNTALADETAWPLLPQPWRSALSIAAGSRPRAALSSAVAVTKSTPVSH